MNIKTNESNFTSYFRRIQYDQILGVFRWGVSGRGITKGAIAGSKTKDGYCQIKLGFKCYRAHRLAWLYVYGDWPEDEIDHINGDPMDNRIDNLRLVDRSGNAQNQHHAQRDNKSCGLLGVTWNKQHNKWQSKIQANKVLYHVGLFNSAEEAHTAYIEKKRKLHSTCGI